jgi:maltose/moltooligosaccharide transporter
LGGMAFSLFLLPYCETSPHVVCLIAAGLYLFAFVMLSLMVTEGQYPPPPVMAVVPGRGFFQRWLERAAQYCREVFLSPYYWTFYLFYVCSMIGVRGYGQFLLLYATETVKMDLRTYGRIETAIGGGVLGVFFLMGPVVDRFHPMRVGIVGFALICVVAGFSYFGIHDVASYAMWVGMLRVATAVFQGATGALLPRILPRQQYGQFCSANAVVFHVGLAAALPLCGWMLDRTRNNALIFLWFFAFSAVGLVLMVALYRQWKALGGDQGYTPPVTAPGAVVEVEMATA